MNSGHLGDNELHDPASATRRMPDVLFSVELPYFPYFLETLACELRKFGDVLYRAVRSAVRLADLVARASAGMAVWPFLVLRSISCVSMVYLRA